MEYFSDSCVVQVQKQQQTITYKNLGQYSHCLIIQNIW